MSKQNTLIILAIVAVGLISGSILWMQNQNEKDTKTEQEITTEANLGLQKLASVDTGKIDFSLDISSSALEQENNYTANITGELNFDASTADNSSLLTIDADLETSQGEISFQDLSLLNKIDRTYLKLQDLDLDDASMSQWGTNVSNIIDQWYLVESQADIANLPFIPSLLSELTSQNVGSEGLDMYALKQALSDTSLFTDVNKLEDETVDDIETYHYSFAGIDPNAARDLLTQLNQETSSQSQNEIQAMQDQLALLSMSGEVWIGKLDGIVKKIKLDISSLDQIDQPLTLGVVINLSELNESVSIDEPQEAGEINTFLQTFKDFPSLLRTDETVELDDLSETDELPELNP